MIRTEQELRRATAALAEQDKHLASYETSLREEGLTQPEIRRMTAAMRTFRARLVEDIATYEQLKSGDLRILRNITSVGRGLVYLRISRGMTQRALAEKLGCDESQVSRDERNEYHGITVERANRIAQALDAKLLINMIQPQTETAANGVPLTKAIGKVKVPKVKDADHASAA